jgi:excisionase family DNA binding protein
VAEQLDETARNLHIAKSQIVAELVSRHLGPDEPPVGIDSLRGAPVGRHSFTPVHELEVLTLEQLATLLEVDVGDAREHAESGELPGRKIAEQWRFSRHAVMAWLAGE